MRARACARMDARAYDCGQIVIRTHDQDQDQDQDQNTPPEKGGHKQSGKPEYICMIAANEKKYKKS